MQSLMIHMIMEQTVLKIQWEWVNILIWSFKEICLIMIIRFLKPFQYLNKVQCKIIHQDKVSKNNNEWVNKLLTVRILNKRRIHQDQINPN